MKTTFDVGHRALTLRDGAARAVEANGSKAASAHVLLIKRRMLWRSVTKWAAGPFSTEAEAVRAGEEVLAEIRRQHGRDEEEIYLFSVERLVAPGGRVLPPEFRPFL
jgi:hypothetical protein